MCTQWKQVPVVVVGAGMGGDVGTGACVVVVVGAAGAGVTGTCVVVSAAGAGVRGVVVETVQKNTK